jgi:hypothetical protein
VKRIGFLSFGHWQPVAGSPTPTAADALIQTIELTAVWAAQQGMNLMSSCFTPPSWPT